VAAAATLSGERSLTAIGEWAPGHPIKDAATLRRLGSSKGKAPSETTIRRSLSHPEVAKVGPRTIRRGYRYRNCCRVGIRTRQPKPDPVSGPPSGALAGSRKPSRKPRTSQNADLAGTLGSQGRTQSLTSPRDAWRVARRFGGARESCGHRQVASRQRECKRRQSIDAGAGRSDESTRSARRTHASSRPSRTRRPNPAPETGSGAVTAPRNRHRAAGNHARNCRRARMSTSPEPWGNWRAPWW
jgi:hypothetical protein